MKKNSCYAASFLWEWADGAGLFVKWLLTIWLARFPEKCTFITTNCICSKTTKATNECKIYLVSIKMPTNIQRHISHEREGGTYRLFLTNLRIILPCTIFQNSNISKIILWWNPIYSPWIIVKPGLKCKLKVVCSAFDNNWRSRCICSKCHKTLVFSTYFIFCVRCRKFTIKDFYIS